VIGIVDYGASNTASITRALDALGRAHKFVSSGEHFDDISTLLLPGVGSFPLAMKALRDRGLIEPIQLFASERRPIVGICLGMQLLFDSSSEVTYTEGLGILSGSVQYLPETKTRGPAFGWDAVDFELPFTEFSGDYYFAHSLAVVPSSSAKVIASVQRESGPVVAGVANDAVLAFQFHPEKSSKLGLALLEASLLGVVST